MSRKSKKMIPFDSIASQAVVNRRPDEVPEMQVEREQFNNKGCRVKRYFSLFTVRCSLLTQKMGRSIKKAILLFGILTCACVLMGQQSVYIWTDEKGEPHISDQKPRGAENVQEMKYGASQREGAEKDDSFYRSQVEEKAKQAEDFEKSQKQAELERKKEEYEKLKAEEQRFQNLRDGAKNPFAYNYATQKLQEIEKEKSKLQDPGGSGQAAQGMSEQ